ncbi:MAG: DMT family transporter [Alphaproteobacteria bacterium]|nr:DMT family transporter [Alphaproteobacteria bacterium]
MNLLTLGLASAFITIWASAFTAARIVALETPPLWALGVRFAICVPLLALIVLATRSPTPARPDMPRVLAMGVFGLGGYLAFAWVASAHIASGLVALLCAITPIFVALGERLWRGVRLPRAAWAGLALGWAGVALLAAPRAAGHGLDALGIGLALAAALSQALGMLILAPARGRIAPWSANLWQTCAGAVLVMSLAITLESPPGLEHSIAGWGAFAWSVLVVGLLAYFLYFTLLARLGPTGAASLQLLAPPMAALIGWLGLGELLRLTDILGGCITLLGLWLLLRR